MNFLGFWNFTSSFSSLPFHIILFYSIWFCFILSFSFLCSSFSFSRVFRQCHFIQSFVAFRMTLCGEFSHSFYYIASFYRTKPEPKVLLPGSQFFTSHTGRYCNLSSRFIRSDFCKERALSHSDGNFVQWSTFRPGDVVISVNLSSRRRAMTKLMLTYLFSHRFFQVSSMNLKYCS